jgi:predicted ArsR family transcriptional regulator
MSEKMIQLTEKQYDLLNELDDYANEENLIYELNCPIVETSKGKYTIVGYELHILDGVLWSKFQEECLSNSIYIF